ncbi:hypothetical protein [Nocardia sp. NBC_00511]|uniref:hypothetical protein n=1 Tax=Nocardia sp. NBC_00511 TaxID=2903591 RepID=UPI0030E49CFB
MIPGTGARTRVSALLSGLAVASVVFGAGCAPAPNTTTAAPAPSMPAPKTAAPPVAALIAAAGEVRVEPGPFTDRVRVTGTRLDGSTVHGTLTVTSDISDVLALEVHAAFYDAAGRLSGTGMFQHADAESVTAVHVPHGTGIDFTITATSAANPVSAVVLSIPVLVNE